MNIFYLGFAAGCLLLQLLPHLPKLIFLFALFALTLGLRFFLKPKKYLNIITIFFALTCGALWTGLYADHILNWSLAKNLEEKNLIVTGIVAELPKYEAKRSSFIFDLTSLNQVSQNARIKLNWYNNFPTFPNFKVGDLWRLNVRIKNPHSTMNPGEFDYEKYLFQNHIRALGYVVSSPQNQRLQVSKRYFLGHLREILKNKIALNLGTNQFTGFIQALIVGDQSSINQDAWQILRTTGTIHFMVIAGLHIGFIASFMFFLGKFLWRRSSRLLLFLPAQIVGAYFALIGAFCYSALAGFSIPTTRAFIQVAVFMLAIIFKRNLESMNNLIVALFLTLLLNPLEPLTSGFWLSFAAVFFILYAVSGRLKNPNNKITRFVHLQTSLTAGLMPLTLYFFTTAPLISIVANAITIPLIGFLVIPLVLIGSTFLFIPGVLGHYFLLAAAKILQCIWFILAKLALFPYANFAHPIFKIWILIFALLGALLILAPRGFPNRFLGLILFLPIFFYKPATPQYGEVWFTLLDVGQGLASVVRTQNHLLIYDTGPKFYPSGDVGESIILPFLTAQNLKKIDMLVVSHADSDHSGGARSLLKNLPVANFYTSVPDFFLPYPATHCYAGQSWQWDGILFTFLHPSPRDNFTGNNACCVLSVTPIKNNLATQNDVLLNGDIEAIAENTIVKNAAPKLHSLVLVAPHHGSSSSSSQIFIDAVKPKYVLFSTGYLNRFHFPSISTVKRYVENQIAMLNTVQTGAITFKFDANSGMLAPILFRETKKHYWEES